MVLKTMTFLTTAQRVNAVVAIINYEFTNIALLLTALEAAGASITQQGNKRLALIGDAALRLVLHEFGFENEYSIGDMTMALNTHATNAHLAGIFDNLGLDAFIQLNPSAQGVIPERLKATTIEAIIGAVYLDCNKDIMTIRQLILHLNIVSIGEL